MNKKPEYRDLALEISKDCIVTKALARLLEQVVEEVTQPLRGRNAKLVAALLTCQNIVHAGRISYISDIDRTVSAALTESEG